MTSLSDGMHSCPGCFEPPLQCEGKDGCAKHTSFFAHHQQSGLHMRSSHDQYHDRQEAIQVGLCLRLWFLQRVQSRSDSRQQLCIVKRCSVRYNV